MPFAAIWMDAEIITQREVRQRQISCDITQMWNLNNDTNELIFKIKMDSQTQKTNTRPPKEKAEVRDKLSVNCD